VSCTVQWPGSPLGMADRSPAVHVVDSESRGPGVRSRGHNLGTSKLKEGWTHKISTAPRTEARLVTRAHVPLTTAHAGTDADCERGYS
jgi:hypothetical protein